MPNIIVPVFSDEDGDLYDIKWKEHSSGYAYQNKKERYAHRIVLERKLSRKLRKGELTDHINRNKIDNRRENLRVADKSLNTVNRDKRPDNTTGYVGVYLFWPKEWREKGWKKKWYARIERKGKIKYLPHCNSPEEAHKTRVAYLADYKY